MSDRLAIVVLLTFLLALALAFGLGRGYGRGEGAQLALEGKAYLLTNVTTNTTVRFEANP